MRIDDVGVVVVNYMLIDAPKEMVKSLKDYYPDVRLIIVDNGSPANVVEELQLLEKLYKNTTVLPLDNNYGYPKGVNAGIKELISEGYQFICCGTTHMLILEQGTLESLKNGIEKSQAAISGPRILSEEGRDQNPVRVERPSEAEAKAIYQKFRGKRMITMTEFLPTPLSRLLKSIKYTVIKSKIFQSIITDKNSVLSNFRWCRGEHTIVYSLHTSFFMLGPLFLKYYEGLDEGSFIYGEELKLAEMLFAEKLKAVYVPDVCIKHREDLTSKAVWKNKANRMKYHYNKESIHQWYFDFYLKNNKLL
jgi:GT2 family glycosyltransferase